MKDKRKAYIVGSRMLFQEITRHDKPIHSPENTTLYLGTDI